MSDPMPTDQPRAVRPGEELERTRLAAYLAATVPPPVGDGALEIQQFPSGFSNLTYRVRYGEQDLVLRRPPVGANVKSGHDMGREFRVLAALRPVFPQVPRPIAYCEDPAVLGAPFYLMERVVGVILRPPLARVPDAATMGAVAESFVATLAAIHALDWRAAGLGDLGRPAGYAQRQVTGWAERYARARTDDLPDLEFAARWLADHVPAETGATLIHNDFKYDNLILDPARLPVVRAVLDWEMATIGDPALDLGTSLAYWVDPADPAPLRAASLVGAITTLPGNPDRRALAEHYATRSGRDVGDLVFAYVYGIFKLAVIAQQIYARFQAGYTTDARFGQLIHMIRLLGLTARRAVELQRIDRLG